MNLIKHAITVGITMMSLSVNATYQRLATCSGITDKRDSASVTLFVNTQKDTVGLVVVNIDGVNDFASDTQINWSATPDGYPRFFNNDFDLDIIVDMNKTTIDDILVENDYIQKLECRYTPKN